MQGLRDHAEPSIELARKIIQRATPGRVSGLIARSPSQIAEQQPPRPTELGTQVLGFGPTKQLKLGSATPYVDKQQCAASLELRDRSSKAMSRAKKLQDAI